MGKEMTQAYKARKTSNLVNKIIQRAEGFLSMRGCICATIRENHL